MDVFIGFITPFPWNWAPQDWSLCQGQLLQIQQNPALYSLIGTSFGGNGSTTFALPELRGKQIIGCGVPATGSNIPLAATGGAQTVTLSAAQLPMHAHTATLAAGSIGMSVSTATPSAATPLLTNGQTGYLANAAAMSGPSNLLKGLYTTTAPTAGATATVPVNATGAITVSPSGESAPVSVMNPYLALNFCICLQGLYPSRN